MNILKIKRKIFIPSLIAFIFFILVVIYILLPVNLSGIYYGHKSPIIFCNESKISSISIPARNTYRVALKKISTEVDQVELCLPIPENGTRLKYSDLLERSEGWYEGAGDTRLTTSKKGAHLVFEIDASTPELTFIKMPSGGKVEITMGDWTEVIDTKNNDNNESSFYTIKLKPNKFKLISNLGPLLSVNKIKIISSAGSSESLKQISISLGAGLSLIEHFQKTPDDIWVITKFSKANIILKCIYNISIAYLSVGVIIIVSYLFGIVLLSGTNANRANNPLHIFCSGLCALYLVINSLTYIFSAQQLVFIFSIFLLFIVILGIYLISDDKNALKAICEYKLPFCISVFASLLVFWPIGISASLFLGLFKTDTFYYTNAATLLQSHSLLHYIHLDSVVGYGMRSIDVTFISLFSLLFHHSPAALWVAVCILFSIIPPMFAYGYSLEHTKQKSVATIAALSVSLSAPITALFFECYFSQYLLTGALYMNLFAGVVLFFSLSNCENYWRTFCPFLLTSSFIVLLYPYFAISSFILSLIILIKLIYIKKYKYIIYSLIFSLVFSNVGLMFFLNPSASQNLVEGLNGIARWIVFPFYNQPKFLGFLSGLTPFHLNDHSFLQICDEFQKPESFAFILLTQILKIGNSAFVYFYIISLTCLFLYVFICNINNKISNKSISIFWFLYLSLSILMIYYVLKTSGLYAYCKMAWTVSCFMPLLLSEQIALFFEKNKNARTGMFTKLIRCTLSSVIIVFLLSNLFSKASPAFLWCANPFGAISKFSYIHVAYAAQIQTNEFTKHISQNANSFALFQPENQNIEQAELIFCAHVFSEAKSMGVNILNPNIVTKTLEVRGITNDKKEQQNSLINITYETN
jgi:hypothetical protein